MIVLIRYDIRRQHCTSFTFGPTKTLTIPILPIISNEQTILTALTIDFQYDNRMQNLPFQYKSNLDPQPWMNPESIHHRFYSSISC